MKNWPWRLIVGSIGGLLILIGILPLAYLLGFGKTHNFEPLSAPISLRRGEYTSPSFKTDLDENYQVEIYFLPFYRTPLDFDWKIVDASGAVIQSGVYNEDEHTGGRGNVVLLTRRYRPRRGSAHRIILNIHQDVQEQDGQRELQPADIRLHIGVPERGLQQAYGSAAAIMWAVGVGGIGAVLVVFLLILRVIRPKNHTSGSNPQPSASQ